MERGGPFSHYQLPQSNSGLISGQTNNNNNNTNSTPTNNSVVTQQQQACMTREQDQFMPIANVTRLMRIILPPHAKISDDAKETIQECVSEYISFVTGEANERCQREQRKTITAEDILFAMDKLGFDNYVPPLSLYVHRFREFETDRGVYLVRGEPAGFGRSGMGFNGPVRGPVQYQPLPSGGFGYGMLDQSMVMGDGVGDGRYYHNGSGQDGSGGAGGSTMTGLPPVYDPYGQFK
ncbi:unnamed protein product [Cochlearia groenlandica]